MVKSKRLMRHILLSLLFIGLAGLTVLSCGDSDEIACGNGIVEAGEECDDGNDSNTDNCLNSCKNPSCGDGFVREGTEDCDSGSNSNSANCDADCSAVECGDGTLNEAAGENCGEPGASELPAGTQCNACVVSCTGGFADCNQDLADGCEVDTSSDVNNCGACGNACTQNDPCVGGTCL